MPKKVTNKSLRVVVLADTHCGHFTGLTPKKWRAYPEDKYYYDLQNVMWDFFVAEIKKLQSIDVLLLNGDLIDGQGRKSGGTELITTDRNKQIMMVSEIVKIINPKKEVRIVAGTGYHTGDEEDWEKELIGAIKGEIDAKVIKFNDRDFVTINGLVFDCKHKVGSSSIPHGRYTAIAKERLWNNLHSIRGTQPKADVLIRSHVHYFGHAGDADSLLLTTPAFQADTRYGSRVCSGTIDVGFLHFDITSKEEYHWQPHLLRVQDIVRKVDSIR
jgi:predicted MPP superfamily phosphohydrolase